MNVALWIVAGVLAVVFLISSAKLVIPKEKIPTGSAAARWVEDFSPGALKAIGTLDLMTAMGLILRTMAHEDFASTVRIALVAARSGDRI